MFSGTPVCGACRAAARIQGLLESGRLPLVEERRVTGLLRGVAGELADLVEAALPGGRGPEEGGTPQSKGETLGRTPGLRRKPLSKRSSPAGHSTAIQKERRKNLQRKRRPLRRVQKKSKKRPSRRYLGRNPGREVLLKWTVREETDPGVLPKLSKRKGRRIR